MRKTCLHLMCQLQKKKQNGKPGMIFLYMFLKEKSGWWILCMYL